MEVWSTDLGVLADRLKVKYKNKPLKPGIRQEFVFGIEICKMIANKIPYQSRLTSADFNLIVRYKVHHEYFMMNKKDMPDYWPLRQRKSTNTPPIPEPLRPPGVSPAKPAAERVPNTPEKNKSIPTLSQQADVLHTPQATQPDLERGPSMCPVL